MIPSLLLALIFSAKADIAEVYDKVDTIAVCRDSALVQTWHNVQVHRIPSGRTWEWCNALPETLIVKRYTPPPQPPTAEQRIHDYINRFRHGSIYWLDVELKQKEPK